MSTPHENSPRVVVYGDATSAQEICIHNPIGVADKLTPPVLAAFYKCFMGVERILTFEHLIYLNNVASKAPDAITDEHSFARNTMVLGLLLGGTMYEVGEALQDLCNAKVAADPALRARWAPLDELRAQWYKDEYASIIRNSFAAHLGERDDYVKGIATTKSDPVTLYQTDGGKRHTGRYRETWDSLFRGRGIQDEDIKAFVDRTHKAHSELPHMMFAFFHVVAEARGVPVIFKPEPRQR